MANGRLGKANIASLQTAEVYKNTSGAEASVTVVAVSPSGTNMNLRIDDTSSALEAVTTIVSEAFQTRFVRYFINNTSIGQTPSFNGRHQLIQIGSTGTTGFEFYDQSNTTTYSYRGNGNAFLASTNWAPLYTVATAEATTRPVAGFIQSTTGAQKQISGGELSDSFDTQDKYYKGTLNQDRTGLTNLTSRGFNYWQVAAAVNHYAPEETPDGYTYENYVHAMGMNSSRYMSTAYSNPVTNTSADGDRSSDSTWIKIIATGGLPTPNAGFPYPYLKYVKNVIFMDGSPDNGHLGFRYMPPSMYTGQGSAENNMGRFRDRVHEDADSRGLNTRITVTTDYKTGGNNIYFEYHPAENAYYLAARDGTSDLYFYKISPDDMATSFAGGNTMRTIALGAENDYLKLATGSIGTTTINKWDDNTTFRIQRVETGKWILGVYRMNNENVQPEFLESTDLLNWTPPSPPSGVQYQATEGDFIVKSVSGTVTATASNITLLALDGILESNLQLVQYERSGLVLSNNDRILVNNSGTANNLSVMVMGYEGT